MCLNIGLDKLIKRLGSTNTNVREKTIQDLIKVGGLAVEHLEQALNNPNDKIRSGAQEVLNKIGENYSND